MRSLRSTSNRFRAPRRGGFALRLVAILLVGVLLVPVLAALGVWALVDPDGWRPQIEAAVQQTTGRTLHIGRLHFVPAIWPTLGATDLALAGLPGDSRPDMATIARAEVRFAPLPLLAGRVEILRLLLVRPDILLERGAAGRPNWQFAAAFPEGIGAGARAGGGGGAAAELPVRALRIEEGRLSWQGRDAASPVSFDLQLLEVAAQGLELPVRLAAEASYAGQSFALTAETGSLSRLLEASAATPWPVRATLETPGVRLAVAGALTHPLAGEGYALSVEGAAVSLSALDGLFAARLPSLRQVAFAARVVDAGGRWPEITDLAVRAGASDLDALTQGLKLTHGELSAAALGEPVRAEALGALRGVPVLVTASLGPLALLLPGQPNPGAYPVELAAEAAGATLAVRGSVAAPARLSGIDLAVTGRIPDLAALSPLAGTALPALRPVTLDARVGDHAGTPGFAIRGLAVTTPAADVSGELAVGLGPRLALQATLASRRIDIDAMLAALPPTAAVAIRGSLPPPPQPPARPGRLIADGRLPFAMLDAADADLRLSVGELRSGGAAYRDLSGRLVLQDGRLLLDPLFAALPGGRLEFRLAVDSRAVPPPVALVLRAPGLSLKPLLAALHLPDEIAGTAEIDAELRGTGDTPAALAAGLGGRLGVAMPDGELNNPLLGGVLGLLLTGAQPAVAALGLDRPGRTRIRCLAIRADAENGLVNVGTLLLDTGRVLLYGAGTLHLRDEGIALRLRPMLRSGLPMAVTVRVGGTFLAPKFAAEPAGGAATVAGLVAGLGVARGTALGPLAAVIVNERDGDPCDPALAAARAGARLAPPKPAIQVDALHAAPPR
jgi:AsmA protein